MTFEEALKQLNDNWNLRGKKYNEMTIDGLVIIPNATHNVDALVRRAYKTHNNTDGFENYSDFEVYAILDIEKYKGSLAMLRYEVVSEILKNLK